MEKNSEKLSKVSSPATKIVFASPRSYLLAFHKKAKMNTSVCTHVSRPPCDCFAVWAASVFKGVTSTALMVSSVGGSEVVWAAPVFRRHATTSGKVGTLGSSHIVWTTPKPRGFATASLFVRSLKRVRRQTSLEND